MSGIPRGVDATNTSPEKALENAMEIGKKLAKKLGVAISEVTDETAIASVNIVDCPLEKGVKQTINLMEENGK